MWGNSTVRRAWHNTKPVIYDMWKIKMGAIHTDKTDVFVLKCLFFLGNV